MLDNPLARWVLVAVTSIVLAVPASAADEPVGRTFHIGLTPVFLDNKVSFLEAWRRYLEARLDARVEFVQRQTYREITELIVAEKLDAAWVCGFPFVRNEAHMRLLAVPLYRDEPLYQSYLIVPSSDHTTKDITDLEGKIFAYSDPNSNSGFLVPQVQLRQAGRDPARFFSRSFFSWSHRDVVEAVAGGLADGGSVDGYVWETLKTHRPDIVARTRVASMSEKFGFPPFVTPTGLSETDFLTLQSVMLGMSEQPEGRALLRELDLDGFVRGTPPLFDGIRRAAAILDGT
jgi:phosphonate transport system substrate-binding protein